MDKCNFRDNNNLETANSATMNVGELMDLLEAAVTG